MELHTSTNYSGQLLSFSFRDFLILIKHRLTSTVVFSAGIGYVLGTRGTFNWLDFLLVLTSGFFITAGANIANQVIEKDTDRLMTRTQNRPVATGKIHPAIASTFSILFGILGVSLLALFTNSLSAIIALSSFLTYAFVYTPLKRKSRISVLIGAFPGAAPTIIGYTAAMGTLDELGILLFIIQFIWQFPHFWAIAWNLDDDYRKAGIFMLPSKKGRSKSTALITLMVSSALFLCSLYLIFFMEAHIVAGVLITLLSINFIHQAYRLYQSRDLKAAKKLMFGSFYYLPLVQLILVASKLIQF
jgi:protoheme IX farnesyltransferase